MITDGNRAATGMTVVNDPKLKSAMDADVIDPPRANDKSLAMLFSLLPRFRRSDEPNGAYRPYTTEFDRIVSSAGLDSVLGPLSRTGRKSVDQAWHELQTGLLPWRTRLHLLAAGTATRIRDHLSADQRDDIVVSLLFDQSGSMRGQKMLFAAATADVTQEFLETLGIACEVLGFTTSRWKGGRSRIKWLRRFSPPHPGRLNDLLHIVYRSADDRRASTGSPSYREMLRPDLPKENLDGEAIQWAVARLRKLPQQRKLLIVLSDGAPVDDSTLRENGNSYLANHLRDIVEDIATSGELMIAAMGIGHDTHDFYPARNHVEAPDELGVALISFLEKLLIGNARDRI
ncbi:MAG: cobaltochelatase CobT-related protein [Sphingobium sp.]